MNSQKKRSKITTCLMSLKARVNTSLIPQNKEGVGIRLRVTDEVLGMLFF